MKWIKNEINKNQLFNKKQTFSTVKLVGTWWEECCSVPGDTVLELENNKVQLLRMLKCNYLKCNNLISWM